MKKILLTLFTIIVLVSFLFIFLPLLKEKPAAKDLGTFIASNKLFAYLELKKAGKIWTEIENSEFLKNLQSSSFYQKSLLIPQILDLTTKFQKLEESIPLPLNKNTFTDLLGENFVLALYPPSPPFKTFDWVIISKVGLKTRIIDQIIDLAGSVVGEKFRVDSEIYSSVKIQTIQNPGGDPLVIAVTGGIGFFSNRHHVIKEVIDRYRGYLPEESSIKPNLDEITEGDRNYLMCGYLDMKRLDLFYPFLIPNNSENLENIINKFNVYNYYFWKIQQKKEFFVLDSRLAVLPTKIKDKPWLEKLLDQKVHFETKIPRFFPSQAYFVSGAPFLGQALVNLIPKEIKPGSEEIQTEELWQNFQNLFAETFGFSIESLVKTLGERVYYVMGPGLFNLALVFETSNEKELKDFVSKIMNSLNISEPLKNWNISINTENYNELTIHQVKFDKFEGLPKLGKYQLIPTLNIAVEAGYLWFSFELPLIFSDSAKEQQEPLLKTLWSAQQKKAPNLLEQDEFGRFNLLFVKNNYRMTYLDLEEFLEQVKKLVIQYQLLLEMFSPRYTADDFLKALDCLQIFKQYGSINYSTETEFRSEHWLILKDLPPASNKKI